MKKIQLLFLLTFIMVGFVACDKEDEKSLTDQNKENLIGNWKFVSSSTNGVQDNNGTCETMSTISFTSDKINGTDYWGENCSESENYSYNYTVNDNSITVTKADGTFISEIVTLNATGLVIKDVVESETYLSVYIKQ